MEDSRSQFAPGGIFLCYRRNTAQTAHAFKDAMEQDPIYTYGSVWYSNLQPKGNYLKIKEQIHNSRMIIFFIGETFTGGFLDEYYETKPKCVTARELIYIEEERQRREGTDYPLELMSINIDGHSMSEKQCETDLRHLFRNAKLLRSEEDVETYTALNINPFDITRDIARKYLKDYIAEICALGKKENPSSDPILISAIEEEQNSHQLAIERVPDLATTDVTGREGILLGKDEELLDYLNTVLIRARDNHPSFILMKVDEIDDRLFAKPQKENIYKQINNMSHFYREIIPLGSTKIGKGISPIWRIIQDSWALEEKRSIVITGEGGIGKTVSLFSLTSTSSHSLHVPAVFIPMYDLVRNDKIVNISDYFSAKYDDYGGKISQLALRKWIRQPQLLVLLDGFNEVPGAFRRKVLSMINDWSEAHPGAQLIAVSRPMDGLNLSEELCGNPISISLLKLDDTTIREYLKEASCNPPAKDSPIWEILRYPLFLNLYIKTDRLNGKLSAGYILRIREPKNGSSLIWNFLQRELLQKNKWSEQQSENWVLRCAFTCEYILPYIAYYMSTHHCMAISYQQVRQLTNHIKAQFDANTLPKHLSEIQKAYKGRHYGEEFLLTNFSDENWYDAVTKDVGILAPAANNSNTSTQTETIYSFLHQSFRDCLAGLYLVNQAEMATGNSLPDVWRQGQPRLAIKHAAELICNDTAEFLWETNRKEKPTIPSALYALLELEQNRNNDMLDFSGMDLRGTSLIRYLPPDGKMHLLSKPIQSVETKMSIATFSPNGHTKAITCIDVAPGGTCLSGSEDASIRVWDLNNYTCKKVLQEHKSAVTCLAVIDRELCISGSKDRSIRIWNYQTGHCIDQIEYQSSVIACISMLSKELFICGFSDGTITVSSLVTNNIIKQLNEHTGDITCLTVLPDKRFISGSKDCTIRLWDIDKNVNSVIYSERDEYVSCMTYLGNNLYAIGTNKGNLQIRNISTQEGKTIKNYGTAIECISKTSNGVFVCGTRDHLLHAWSYEPIRSLGDLKGHTGRITCVVHNDDGTWISGSKDEVIRIWSEQTRQCVGLLRGSSVGAFGIAFTSDGKMISSHEDGALRLWDLSTKTCRRMNREHFGVVDAVAVSAKGICASCSDDKTICVWDLVSGSCVKRFEGHRDWVRCIAFDSHGKCATGCEDGVIRIWNFENGDSYELIGHEGSVRGIAFTPDGQCVSCSEDKTVRVWNLQTGESKTLRGHEKGVTCISINTKGTCVTGSMDGTVRIWSLEDGSSRVLEGHTDFVECVTINNDGIIASGSHDKSVHIWNLANGVDFSLSGHTDIVRAIAFDSHGKCYSGANEGVIRIWDIEKQECIGVLRPLGVDVSSVFISKQARIPAELNEALIQNGATVEL